MDRSTPLCIGSSLTVSFPSSISPRSFVSFRLAPISGFHISTPGLVRKRTRLFLRNYSRSSGAVTRPLSPNVSLAAVDLRINQTIVFIILSTPLFGYTTLWRHSRKAALELTLVIHLSRWTGFDLDQGVGIGVKTADGR